VKRDEYTLSDLVEVTGAKRRSLQVWADRGVIQPLPDTASAGTGVHRRFSREEAIIACLIHPFASHQMAIGELLIISRGIRGLFRVGEAKLISAAIGGSGDSMLVYQSFFMRGSLQHNLYFAAGKEIKFPSRRDPNSICMAIRLETYLSKLD
jgi:hypothetical protein